jgi:hypothetical protein
MQMADQYEAYLHKLLRQMFVMQKLLGAELSSLMDHSPNPVDLLH